MAIQMIEFTQVFEVSIVQVRVLAKWSKRTLNQRVHGSSPCAPTIEINHLFPEAQHSGQIILGFMLGNYARLNCRGPRKPRR